MKLNLSTDGLKLGEVDLKLITSKLERLENVLHPPFLVDIRLSHDKHHQRGEVITCRLNVKQSGRVFNAERSSSTVQNAIDLAITVIRKELLKYREKKMRREKRKSIRAH